MRGSFPLTMAEARDCEARGIKHQWKRRPEWYSQYSTQPAGYFWRCERCGKETDTDQKPAD